MELTRIEKENLEGFASFLPADLLTEEDQGIGVLSEEGYPLGAAILSPSEEGAALKWIFVDPEERRKGVATLMLHDAMTLLRGSVPVFTVSYSDEAEGVEELLVHLGFTVTEGDPVYVIPMERVFENPVVMKLVKRSFSEKLICLAGARPQNERALQEFLAEEAGSVSFLEGADPDYSFMTCTEELRPVGCILASKADTAMEVKLLLNRAPGNVEQLIFALIQKCMEDSAIQELCFVAAAPKLEQVVDHMLNGDTAYKDHLRYAVVSL